MSEDTTPRINKYLSIHGGYSRREADELIKQGRVTIDGAQAELGGRVNPGNLVAVDGKVVAPLDELTYIAFHKPVGYVCSRRAQGETPTIYELLPSEYHHLKTVGRLDKDSSGIILLTNDGDFTHRMTHPKYHKHKLYQIELDAPLQPLHRQMISDFGVMLEDGKSQFEIERIDDADDKKWQLTLTEGRNRQIRRTFSALGYTVVKLHRIKFGDYDLANLPSSQWRSVQP